MITKLKTSKKPIIQAIINVTFGDCQSTTGRNLRGILLETNRDSINVLDPSVIGQLLYRPQEEDCLWVSDAVKELLLLGNSELSEEDVVIWTEILCTL